MQIPIHPDFEETPAGQRAAEVLGRCVHCGFCNATCPTYQVTGDENDGPRGRIYLIADLFEHGTAAPAQQRHLDRCLTCRACESTCPSGVEYVDLLELARPIINSSRQRPLHSRALRFLLRHTVSRVGLLQLALSIGNSVRGLLPASLAGYVPRRTPRAGFSRLLRQRLDEAAAAGGERVVLLEGCVQQAATPQVNDAARRILARLGIAAERVPAEGCCGALDLHLGEDTPALRHVRANVRWAVRRLDAGVTRIVSTASGCGVTWRDYGKLLEHDPLAADAARVAAASVDVGTFLAEHAEALRPWVDPEIEDGPVVFQAPCTLQHGLRGQARVEQVIRTVGGDLRPSESPQYCCGSAGTYSLLQPELARGMRERKLEALLEREPTAILTANIGCQLWLQQAPVPVRHWLEWLDDRLLDAEPAMSQMRIDVAS